MAPRRPTSTGRKKIEIRRLKTKEKRQVCFSKRRTELFNKATELGVMCGVEVAAVTFSQGGKAFTYDHPSVESVLELRARLEAEKARKEAAEEAWAKAHAEGIQAAVWMDAFAVCQMGEEDLLVAFKAALEKMAARARWELQQALLLFFTLHGRGADYMHQKRNPAPGFDPSGPQG